MVTLRIESITSEKRFERFERVERSEAIERV